MFKTVIAFLLVLAVASAFNLNSGVKQPALAKRTFSLKMSEGEKDEETVISLVKKAEQELDDETPAEPATYTPKKSEPVMINEQGGFANNERSRVGVSRDEDGKSNVWAVFPKEEVVDSQADSGSLSTAAVLVAGLSVLVAATISFLPSPDSL
ncbi:unnamed protein product [Heterosigma akashiwo]|mmetsp:Transcript_9255/g.15882  ORF Transcript_9255/g.15882 Transcript_9255/m.15882 type:complete len:153 (-) Transcript_9255:576-1034(-)